MKRYIVLLLSMLLTTTLMAQKPKNVDLTQEGLPDELLEWMNKSTSDKGKQKENTKVLQEFKSAYNGFDSRLQKRLVDFYGYAVKAKMKANPEMCTLTRVLTSIATTPAGGKDLNDAYANVPNLDGFVSSLETFAKRNAKEVQRNKISVQLEPMTPDERRIVHNTLTGWEHIKTESSGEGRERAVTIKYVD